MKVAIRADASRRIGSGHIARCVTLGSELRRRGAQVAFIARDHEEGWYWRVVEAGFDLFQLPRPTGPARLLRDADYASWLGVDAEVDASETIALMGDEQWDLVIVDHYALGADWENQLRHRAQCIMAIDDLANRVHDVDVLLDQNLRADGGAVYRRLVPEGAKILSGPGYALLDRRYQRARPRRSQSIEHGSVLVSLGSVADTELLLEIVGSLLSSTTTVHSIHIVDPLGGLSGWSPSRRDVECVVHDTQPDLVNLMLGADVAVGAGGLTTWERACLGLPTVTVCLADNQSAVLEALADTGAILHLGDTSCIEVVRDCGRAVAGLLVDRQRWEAMSRLGRTLVDGRGTERVAEALSPLHRSPVLRRASRQDAGMLWLLANSVDVRTQAVRSGSIPWVDHVDWLEGRLGDADTDIFVLEADGVAVGQIRFEIDARRATVDYAIDACTRGRGWGSELVEMGTKRLLEQRKGQIDAVVAHVKQANEPSKRVFARLGFVPVDRHRGDGLAVFERRVPPDHL